MADRPCEDFNHGNPGHTCCLGCDGSGWTGTAVGQTCATCNPDPITPDALREAVAQRLRAMHFDGQACGDPRSPSACLNCAGPSPMTASEVADAVLAEVAKHRDAEVERLESIEFIHHGCKGIHDRDVQTVLDQRDRIVAYLAGTEWEHPVNQILTGTDG